MRILQFCFITTGTDTFFCLWGYRDSLSYFNERNYELMTSTSRFLWYKYSNDRVMNSKGYSRTK